MHLSGFGVAKLKRQRWKMEGKYQPRIFHLIIFFFSFRHLIWTRKKMCNGIADGLRMSESDEKKRRCSRLVEHKLRTFFPKEFYPARRFNRHFSLKFSPVCNLHNFFLSPRLDLVRVFYSICIRWRCGSNFTAKCMCTCWWWLFLAAVTRLYVPKMGFFIRASGAVCITYKHAINFFSRLVCSTQNRHRNGGHFAVREPGV